MKAAVTAEEINKESKKEKQEAEMSYIESTERYQLGKWDKGWEG